MSTKLIVIVGATGMQGGSVARRFANKPGWKVRGISRDVSSTASVALRGLGVDMVVGDLDDPQSLSNAFLDAHVVFINTDFWQFLRDPATFATSQETGSDPNEIACERETQLGKNAIDAVAKYTESLDRLVLTTFPDTNEISGGNLAKNFHFQSKAAVAGYLKERYASLASKTSYLQTGMYLQNWQYNPALRPTKIADGTFVIRLPEEYEHYLAPFSNPAADVGYFVEALVAGPPSSCMVGYCQQMEFGQFWRTWAKSKGVTLEIKTEDFAFGDLPPWLARQMKDDFMFCATYGFTGGNEQFRGPESFGIDFAWLTSIEEWVLSQDWSSLL